MWYTCFAVKSADAIDDMHLFPALRYAHIGAARRTHSHIGGRLSVGLFGHKACTATGWACFRSTKQDFTGQTCCAVVYFVQHFKLGKIIVTFVCMGERVHEDVRESCVREEGLASCVRAQFTPLLFVSLLSTLMTPCGDNSAVLYQHHLAATYPLCHNQHAPPQHTSPPHTSQSVHRGHENIKALQQNTLAVFIGCNDSHHETSEVQQSSPDNVPQRVYLA